MADRRRVIVVVRKGVHQEGRGGASGRRSGCCTCASLPAGQGSVPCRLCCRGLRDRRIGRAEAVMYHGWRHPLCRLCQAPLWPGRTLSRSGKAVSGPSARPIWRSPHHIGRADRSLTAFPDRLRVRPGHPRCIDASMICSGRGARCRRLLAFRQSHNHSRNARSWDRRRSRGATTYCALMDP